MCNPAENADKLPSLPGAVQGAKEFAEWAKSHEYAFHLVTDEGNQRVTVQRLTDIVKAVLKDIPERLLLYFAGHGIQPTSGTAYWLLSNWEDDSDEAVNVTLSLSNAKRSGIEQIGVFADACRSTVADAASVGGRSIFPKSATSLGKQPQWDQFFASRLGEIAQEVAARSGVAAYGIFTQCLVEALGGRAPDAIEARYDSQGTALSVVTSARLATFLEENVPLRSGEIAGAVVQMPDANPGWRAPRDVYLTLLEQPKLQGGQRPKPPPPVHSPAPAPAPSSPVAFPSQAPAPAPVRAVAVTPSARLRTELDAAVRANQTAFAAAEGRAGFETGQGLTVVGANAMGFAVRAGKKADLFREGGHDHVRGHGGAPQPVLVVLENDRWIGALILPEFVATIVIREGAAASVSYAPARNGIYPPQPPEVMDTVHHWTALMHQGRSADSAGLRRAADLLRIYKYANPALGVLAAYAYERAGNLHGIDDVLRSFATVGYPVPFDVALLSSASLRSRDGRISAQLVNDPEVAVAGSFPLLTQGWALLDADDPSLDEPLRAAVARLIELRRGLVPSLWTTLDGHHGVTLAGLILNGSI